MVDEYDVVVIGAGPAGENVADRARRHGLSVVVVERELVGGECSYWACMPSKALLRPGEVLAAARAVPGAATAVTGSIDAEAALRARDRAASGFDDQGQVSWLREADITLVRGQARLAGPRTVEVTTADDTTRHLTARRGVVVAVGTRSAAPPIEGLDRTRVWDNRAATEASAVPRRLLVLGGGAVGVELAQAWRRLGSEEVTLVERGPRLLSTEEPAAGELLGDALRVDGIRVELGAEAVEVQRASDDAPVELRLADDRTLVADELLVAVGRRVPSDDLGLDTVGVEPGPRGVVAVDDHLRVPGHAWLFVVGDANGRALLTHHGKYQARLVGDALADLEVDPPWADRRALTRVVFTDPQVASVGLTSRQAREAGLDVVERQVGLDSVAAASLLGQGLRGLAHLVIDTGRDVVVGATFVGPGAGELLHAATVAIVGEVPLSRLEHAVPPFPSISEVWLRLLEQHRTEGRR
ncbi:dihydrolipoyl dehydrogenase family protein [Egicoccus halophilus]|uniref:Oxidoreductase n=1 Tax=Egicoccus halophilus TaxID=1670830 RepID=A0A8J3EWW8_9ACTN|nr:NAD(P)/FAD-dependent oxidoreductase [Egicoccus halophilus]GGI04573.1 oxidoreductase [Egicoccus halophilus]